MHSVYAEVSYMYYMKLNVYFTTSQNYLEEFVLIGKERSMSIDASNSTISL